jgi:hypothetical protein
LAFATCLAVVVFLAALTVFTGRLHVALLGPTWLRSLGPLEAAVSSLIGTAWWTVLLTTLSLQGLVIPSAAGLILVAHAIAFGVFAWRGEFSTLRPRGGMSRWGAILIPALFVALVGLLPVLRKGSFATANDSLTYCSMAQWLQDHAFGTPIAWRGDEPIAFYPALYQGAQAPLAPAFLLAGTQAITRVSSSLVVYPALSTFGLLLAVVGILTAGRWILGWPIRWLAPLGLVIAALPQPLVWAHHSGFLAQTFGTPALLGVLITLARGMPPRRWRVSEAILMGLLTASLSSTYLALLPVAVGAGAWWLASAIGRRRAWNRVRPLAAALGVFAAVVLTLLAGQGVSVTRGLGFLGGVVVGFHVGVSSIKFASLALGAWLWPSEPLAPWLLTLSAFHLWLAPLYAVLALLGAYRMARMPRAGGLLASALVLALGVAYFALLALDPWTHERGHTWNVFKLAQWAYPLVLMAVLHGLWTLAARPGVRRVLPWLTAIPLGLFPLQWGKAGVLGNNLETFVGAPRPLDGWPALCRAFSALPPGALLAADRLEDTTQQLPTYLGLLAYPRRLAGDWTGSLWVSPDPDRRFVALWDALGHGLPQKGPEKVLPLVTGLHGFVTDAVERLGGQIGLVREGHQPQVLAIFNPSDDAPGPGGCVWLGRARTRVMLFSPGQVAAILEMDAIPGPGASRVGQRLVVDTPVAASEVLVDRYPKVRVPIKLERGISHAEIRFPDLNRNVPDRRRLCVASFHFGSVEGDGRAPGPAGKTGSSAPYSK